MKTTTNYQLNQWESSDRVTHTDFNADNTKIDAALKAQADAIAAEAQNRQTLAAQITGRGNCQIVTGRYVGTGEYGRDNPNTLTFPQKPLMVFIQPVSSTGGLIRLLLVQGCSFAFANMQSVGGTTAVTWSGNSVSWYSNNTGNQCSATFSYAYVALLATDA